MFIDSHCHVNFPELAADLGAVTAAMAANKVTHALCVCVNLEHFASVLEVAQRYPNIYASAGVHPDERSGEEPDIDRLVALAAQPKVVAIGETGLDYYYDNSPRDIQREVFRRQLALAKKLDLPVIIHTRDADDDTIALLKAGTPSRGVIHCFTSGDKLADFVIDCGFYISFSGIVTFPKAQPLAEIARRIPANRILVETDCPYLAPVPHRGKRNEPSFVADTARFLATLRGSSPEDFATQTSENFDRLFASNHF